LQTGKSKIIPLVLVDKPGGEYWLTWHKFMREHLMKAGLISEEDFAFFAGNAGREFPVAALHFEATAGFAGSRTL
jgi:hypothetical protein